MILKALCIISYLSVNSNSSYRPETQNSGQNQRFVCPVWPWNLTDDLEKKIGYIFCTISNFMHHSMAIWKFWLELTSRNTQTGAKFDLTSIVITINSMMMHGLEHSEKGVTDRQAGRRTDWTILRAVWSQLKEWSYMYKEFVKETQNCTQN